jgi:DNA repair exonuclease SbcCD ATPase subunit
MDERKKTIGKLEEKKREIQGTVESLLEKLGKSLLAWLDKEGAGPFLDELEEYRRILGEIAKSEESIRVIEADTLRLKELEGEISENEKDSSVKTKELSALYARLGEGILETGFAAAYKEHAEALVQKIQSLEDRLRELDEGKHINIFTWIGNNTQGMVLRSLITKNQAGLERVYIEAGEQYFARREQGTADNPDNPAVGVLLDQVSGIRRELAELDESLTRLRNERRKITDSLGTEGGFRTSGSAKKIKTLERHISHAREQLTGLHIRFGAQFADIVEDGSSEEEALLKARHKAALEKVRKLREEIAEYDASIEKLRASLLIDEAREGIEKMEKAITGHRQRIAASEDAISGLKRQIEESNRRIQELMKITDEDIGNYCGKSSTVEKNY